MITCIRSLLSKLAHALSRLFFGKGPEEFEEIKPIKERAPRKWWEWPFRVIQTSQGGPNMPRYQPCPRGHGWKKRISKSITGAWYFCNRCQEKFFVKSYQNHLTNHLL